MADFLSKTLARLGILRGSGGGTRHGDVLSRPADHVANPVSGGGMPVPNALFRTQRGQQHLPLPPDQSAGTAEGRQRRVCGKRVLRAPSGKRIRMKTTTSCKAKCVRIV